MDTTSIVTKLCNLGKVHILLDYVNMTYFLVLDLPQISNFGALGH